MRFNTHIQLGDRRVGPGEPVLVIAEAGVSHFADPGKAIELVDLAADAGADVFKTQAFHTDELVSARLPEWRERLRPKEVDFDFLDRMRARCEDRGIAFLCTPHEKTVLPWLDKWDVPAIKIGSGERGNTPFFREIAQRKKPVILSTGMYEMGHVRQALDTFAGAGQRELALLHCVTSYPADARDVNLRAMEDLRSVFPGPVGYSDHTRGHHVCLAAVALGADIIEKHITLDFDVPNAQDWKVSAGPDDFADFVRFIREVESARGDGCKQPRDCEVPAMKWALKSLVVNEDLAAGTVLAEAHLAAKRPGDGIQPYRIDELVGRRLKCALERDQAIEWDMLE